MNTIDTNNIPEMLRERPQWVMWGAGKVPFQVNGSKAKPNDPSTWTDYVTASDAYLLPSSQWDGIGFVFSDGGGLVGVDLDGCRNQETGQVADWAREIICSLNTYAEVSPSKTGVKLFLIGKSPLATGRKKDLLDVPRMNEKTPAIEIYDKLRFFAVTGWRLSGPTEPQERPEALSELVSKYFAKPATSRAAKFESQSAVVERARKYLANVDPAVSGQSGHNTTFRAACVLVLGFGLTENESLGLLSEWNARCVPPWSDQELRHKIESANAQPGERNYLRNVQPSQWGSVSVPSYSATASTKPQPKITTLHDAATKYIEKLKAGETELIDTGLVDLDYAIGGGVEKGEMVIVAARPSHGKSAIALQCVHNWTKQGRNCLVVSEEMSAMALGKRTLLFASESPSEHWKTSSQELEDSLALYSMTRATAYVAESCGTTEAVVEQIEKFVTEHHVECVVVDYAQLLKSEGKSRYEQVTNTSIMLKQACAKHNIVLILLCQISRAIEARTKFNPMLSDLKDSGQLEQDADVIIFLVWPHRLDSSRPAHEYQFFIGKNRNREINQNMFVCRFEPSRQRVTAPKAKDMPNYEASFAEYGGF